MTLFRRLFGTERPRQGAGRPLRLLYLVHQFYPAYRNGTEKFVLQLARSMQARGHQAQVVTYRTRPGLFWHWPGEQFVQQRYTYGGVPVLALRHVNCPPQHRQQIEDELQYGFAREYLRRWRPDLVHVGHAMRVSGFVWAAQELGIPTFLTLTDYWLLCPKIILIDSQDALCRGPAQGAACRRACPELDETFIRRRLAVAEQIVRRARGVVAPSAYLAQVFRREWPWLTLQIVPHGIDPWAQHRRQYEPNTPLVFAYAGSLNRHKGVHVLIEAFRGVQSATARLLIYGSGPDEAALHKQAADDPRVQFRGVYREHEASRVFAGMDVLVAPSTWPENRPFVLYEALASGVPLVVTNVGGMVEAVEHGVTGLVVPPGDPLTLRTALQELVDRPKRLNAFKAAIGGLTIQTVAMEAEAYATIYRTVMGENDEIAV